MEKIWLKSYPADVPETIDTESYQSLNEAFEIQCQKFSNKIAFINFGTKITYRQMDKLSRDFANFLRKQLEMQKGDRFAIMLPNIIQFPIAMYGALRAGLTVVTV